MTNKKQGRQGRESSVHCCILHQHPPPPKTRRRLREDSLINRNPELIKTEAERAAIGTGTIKQQDALQL